MKNYLLFLNVQLFRRITILSFVALLLFPVISFADGSTTTRNKCRWYSKKYVAHAHVSSFLILYNQWKNDAKCEYTQVVANGNVPCSYAAAGNGPSSSWISTYTTASYCGAGSEYTMPELPPSNPEGFSRSEFSQKILVQGSGNHGIIKIQNIEGLLSASTNSKFSSFYRIVIWVPQDDEAKGYQDTLITPKKVLWEASVRIEDGKLITTGGFRDIDFDLVYSKDSIYDEIAGINKVFLVKQIKPVDNPGQGRKISKNLFLQDIINDLLVSNPRGVPLDVLNNVTMDDIAVTAIGSSGYGYFKDELDPLYVAKNASANNLSINIPAIEPYINVYPNPSTTKDIQIDLFLENENTIYLELLDISGRVVYSNHFAIKEDELNTIYFERPDLQNGIYYLRINKGNGTLSRKIIISE